MTRHLTNPLVVLGSVLILGAALRLFAIGTQSLWYDESFSVVLAKRDLATIIAGSIEDRKPPLYYLLLHFWLYFGQGDAYVRLLSAIFGLASLPMVYLVGRRMLDARAGLLATFILAISPFHIYYSQETRMYSLLTLASLASLFFFITAWRSSKLIHWLLFGIFAAVAIYAQYLGFLFLVTVDLWLLIGYHKAWAQRKGILTAHLAAIVLLLPWLVVMPGQVQAIASNYWIPAPNPLEWLRTIDIFTLNATNLTVPGEVLPVAYFVSLAVLAIMLSRTARSIISGKEREETSLLLFVLFGPIALLYLLAIVRSLYAERAIGIASLAYYLLVARTGVRTRGLGFKSFLIIPLVLLMGVSLSYYYFDATYAKYPMREVASYLKDNVGDGDVVLHAQKASYVPVMYYQSLPRDYLAPEEPGSPHSDLTPGAAKALGIMVRPVEDASVGAHRIWFVLTWEYTRDYHLQGEKSWLDSHFRLTQTKAFRGVDVLEYERKE